QGIAAAVRVVLGGQSPVTVADAPSAQFAVIYQLQQRQRSGAVDGCCLPCPEADQQVLDLLGAGAELAFVQIVGAQRGVLGQCLLAGPPGQQADAQRLDLQLRQALAIEAVTQAVEGVEEQGGATKEDQRIAQRPPGGRL